MIGLEFHQVPKGFAQKVVKVHLKNISWCRFQPGLLGPWADHSSNWEPNLVQRCHVISFFFLLFHS